MKRISLQWRITLMTVLLIGVTCVAMNLLLCSSGVYYMDTIADTLQGSGNVLPNEESMASLLRGLSISLITILGYTAITGSVGAGGLGNIAFRYGYQRYQTTVMYATVVLLILLVCIIQILFDRLARRADKRNR